MAGVTLVWLLDEGSYDKFYELIHEYAELLIVNAGGISSYSFPLEHRVIKADEALSKFQHDLESLQVCSARLEGKIRPCFWPNKCGNESGLDWDAAHEADEALNHERWFPYDDVAWDRFFSEIQRQLLPDLDIIKQAAERLEFLPSTTYWNKVKSCINNLQKLLDADLLEADYSRHALPHPEIASQHFERALARPETDYDGQIADYSQAIYYHNNSPSYHNRGLARFHQGNLEGAIKDFTQASRLFPANYIHYFMRGLARERNGDLAGAAEDYHWAERFHPQGAIDRAKAEKPLLDYVAWTLHRGTNPMPPF